mmetsp:Transcript_36450/g.68681  ORF Transcript_36450/g.68681 Transcript_36450/m.68681 type:complete len:189 (-) Transcript_36450:243-809(-)
MKEIIDSIPTEYRWLIVAGFLPADVLDENGTKCGKDVVTLGRNASHAMLCRPYKVNGPKCGGMWVAVAKFELAVLPGLVPVRTNRIMVVGEINKFTMCSRHFKAALFLLLASKRVVFGSLPAAQHGEDAPEVELIKQRADTMLIHVTRSNAESVKVNVRNVLGRMVRFDMLRLNIHDPGFTHAWVVEE